MPVIGQPCFCKLEDTNNVYVPSLLHQCDCMLAFAQRVPRVTTVKLARLFSHASDMHVLSGAGWGWGTVAVTMALPADGLSFAGKLVVLTGVQDHCLD